MIGELPSLAIKMSWAHPGLTKSPIIVPPPTAAAAPAGLMPALIINGISVAPTVAAVPAALMMAMLMRKVTTVAIRISQPPIFLSGEARSTTRCSSHLEKVTAAAKPIAAQIGGTRLMLTMPLIKDWKAAIG